MMELPVLQELDGLLIDIGGVLIGPDWHRVAALLAAHQVPVLAADLFAAELRVKRRMERPGPDPDAGRLYYERVLREAGYSAPVSAEVWKAVIAEHHRYHFWHLVPPGVSEALARLHAAGLRLAVVSNSTGIARQLLEDVGLAPLFHTIVDSQVEGIEKPHPEIFRRAIARLDVKSERAIHVGDLYHVDVLGARAAGVAGVLIDVAGLYEEADCPRFSSFVEFSDALLG
jgi:putative hydrolase of the HAD superfamily